MARLTVVFEYPDGASLTEAKAMFNKGNIPNLVGVVEYDAIEAYKEAIGNAMIKVGDMMNEAGDEASGD